jgi:hypothetical protein
MAVSFLISPRRSLTPSLVVAGQLGLLMWFLGTPDRGGLALIGGSVVAIGEEGLNGLYLLVDVALFSAVTIAVVTSSQRPRGSSAVPVGAVSTSG